MKRDTRTLAFVLLATGCPYPPFLPVDDPSGSVPSNATTGTSPSDATTTTTSDAGSSTSDATELPSECTCIDAHGALTCAVELCPMATGECLDQEDIYAPDCPREWKYDTAALACALAAARDGTEGTIRWEHSPTAGFSGHGGYYHIFSGRRAIHQEYWWWNHYGEASATQLRRLADPAYFEACIDLATDDDRFDCLIAGTTGDPLAECSPRIVLPELR